MSKLVCIKCQCELRAETTGIVVIETASFGPYKIWNADILKCPGCGVKIVAGFSEKPWRQDHWKDDFKPWLESVIAMARRVIYDNEQPTITEGVQAVPVVYVAGEPA